MIETILFFAHYALTLLFGIVLSFAFCGLRFVKKTNCLLLFIFALCGVLQLSIYGIFGETATWELYPLITHFPLGILLCGVFKKRFVTVLSSITLSYLCCQPSKWFGLFTGLFTDNNIIVLCVRLSVILLSAFIAIRFFASYISEIFSKDTKSVLIISGIPLVYYVFDYAVGIYTDLHIRHIQLVTEFLSFFLCVAFVAFCVVYYKEHEKKAEAERKEQIIAITAQQQIKELDAIRQSTLETRLLRHDMRFLLGNLALSIQQGDTDKAISMISGFTDKVDAASVKRYCRNDTINYVLLNFQSRCAELDIDFAASVEIGDIFVDEIMLSSIISNALDNAIHAQSDIAKENRQIKLMLKDSDGKLLFSVKNPFSKPPLIIDGLPVSNQKGHGYGTQSIRYMTEKLGGKYQFITENNLFILRVIL